MDCTNASITHNPIYYAPISSEVLAKRNEIIQEIDRFHNYISKINIEAETHNNIKVKIASDSLKIATLRKKIISSPKMG